MDQFNNWSPRYTLVDEPEYIGSYQTCDLGDDKVMTFVHLEVFHMGPDVFKRLRRQFSLLRQYMPMVLYCMGDEDNEKFERFISYFGFKYLREVPCTDGRTRRLFWCP